MRLILASLAALTLTCHAYADQYEFRLTGIYDDLFGMGTYADDFIVDTSLLIPVDPHKLFPTCGPPDCFTTATTGGYDFIDRYGRVDLLDNERGDDYPDAVYFFSKPGDDPFSRDFQLFTGPATNPLVATGNDFTWGSNLFGGYARGTATITDLSTASPVPEPSTLALLGTGILGLTGALRRRIRA